jgi:hypothetical protein
MNVSCRTNKDAAELTTELSKATALLRAVIEREHRAPNPADLSGVLASGAFLTVDSRVMGYWRIEQVFFDNLLSEPRP